MKYAWEQDSGKSGEDAGRAEGEVEQGLGPVTASINSMGALELENMLKNCPKLGQEAQVLIPCNCQSLSGGAQRLGDKGSLCSEVSLEDMAAEAFHQQPSQQLGDQPIPGLEFLS